MSVEAPAAAEERLFLDFFYLLRANGVKVSSGEWLTFMAALDAGLAAASLHRFYALSRSTLVKTERHYDVFDQCFTHYFMGARPPEGFNKAVDSWLDNPLPMPQLSETELAALERYGLDELKKLFEERLAEQNERHDGGSKWIGTGGRSPFGHGGVHPSGIRVGGQSGSRTAIQVAAKRRFKSYRADLTLDVRQMGVALRRLRRFGRDGRAVEVDIDATIEATAKNAGDLEIMMRPPRENRLKVLLLMDVGGSMDPFAHLVSRLFSAAHKAAHFKEFHAYYFHNCIYERVFKSARMTESLSTPELCRWLQPETRVIYLGDAHMAPYELISEYGASDYYHQNERTGLSWMKQLAAHFPHQAWLNPISKRYWAHPTISMMGEVVPMHELTLEGLEAAIDALT